MPTRIDILFQKFIEGSCSKQEYDELMDLLQQNQHEEKLRSMLSHVYQHTARSLPSGIYVDNTGSLQDTGGSTGLEIEQPVRQKRQWTRWGVVAVVFLAAGLLWMFRGQKEAQSSADSSVKNVTQRGEQKQLVLPDSSRVWMNVASTLEFPETFEGNTREVYLTGEAYFEIRRAGNKAFVIHTGNVTTRVMNAAFDLKAYPDQTNVVMTVKRGRVEVSRNGKVAAALTAGQQVRLGTGKAVVSKKKAVDWINGFLNFDSVPLTDVLKDLERYYNANINLENEVHELVTIAFKREIGVEQALTALCAATHSQLRKENAWSFYIKPIRPRHQELNAPR